MGISQFSDKPTSDCCVIVVDNTHASAGQGRSRVLNCFLRELQWVFVNLISLRDGCTGTASKYTFPRLVYSRLLLRFLIPAVRIWELPNKYKVMVEFEVPREWPPCWSSRPRDDHKDNLDYSAILLFVSFCVSDTLVLDWFTIGSWGLVICLWAFLQICPVHKTGSSVLLYL